MKIGMSASHASRVGVTVLAVAFLGFMNVRPSQAASAGLLVLVYDKAEAADVALGDINRDGFPDMCVATSNNKGLLLFQGDLNRNWAVLAAAGLPTSGSYSAVALADLDRNGLLDIVASEGPSEAGALVVYRQAPRGTWTDASGALPTASCFAKRIVLEDFNRDGLCDIATAGPNGVWLIKRNFGPDLWDPVQLPQAATESHSGLAFFDWSGDGLPDLVATCDGAVGGGIRYWTQPAAGVWPRQAVLIDRAKFNTLRTADLNLDGIPDLLAAYGSGLVIRSGAPGFPEMSDSFLEPAVQSDFVVGNWPADADREIFSCNSTQLSIFTGLPGASWQLDSRDTAVGDLTLRDVADCDRDGAPDIGCFDGSGLPCVYYNHPTSETVLWMENSPPLPPPFRAQCFDTGDPDRDGDTDLLLGREATAEGLAYYEGDGGASWLDATVAELPQHQSFSVVALHDFDFDGYEDGFFVSKSGDGILYSKRRSNGWVKAATVSPPMQYSTITFANFRTFLDVVVASPPGAEGIDFFQYTGGAPGMDWTRTVGDTGGLSVKWVAAGDFNGDGVDEIASADSAGAFFLFSWSGTDWVVLRAGLPQNLQVSRFVVEDVDRDSYPDIIAIGKGDGIYVILNRYVTTEVLLLDDSQRYLNVSIEDSNLDGIPDILAVSPIGIDMFLGDNLTSWTTVQHVAKPTTGSLFTDAGFAFLDKDDAVDIVALEDDGHIRLFYSKDGSPPGGWHGFSPDGWITTFNPDCRVAVMDNVGVSTSTALYEYSTDGGATWSTPAVPEVNASMGGRSAELIARAVPFPDSSRDQYWIRFTIQDVNGNVGISPEYNVQIDAVPPTNPTLIFTLPHEPGIWNRLNRIQYSWPAGTDEHSGIAGYSVEITRAPDTVVNSSIEFGPSDRLQRTLNLVDANDWYIHLRTVDRAGNVSVDTMRVGPFFIDRSPPDPPVITIDGANSASWPEWYKGHQTVQINRGNDGGESAFYIRHRISRNALTDPSTGPDAGVPQLQIPTSTTITTYETWYVHAVTVDRAGNLSDVVHAGPLQIDVNPPWGRLAVTPDSSTGDRVRVELSDMTDRGAGVLEWRLLYRLAGELAWTTWATYSNTAPDQVVTFVPPDPAEEYQLVAQFEDNVGWVSSVTNPLSTRFEQNVVIETEVEIAHAFGDPTFELREGVKVYKGDDFIGTTDASGRITVPDVAIGDEITALYLLGTLPSRRRDREELGGDPWAYRQYLTNVEIGNDGVMSGHIVETNDNPLRLTLRRRNSLIGFHLVGAISWNAGGMYLDDLRNRFERASDYLYKTTDGQMFLELVEIYENRSFWDDGGDVRIHFNKMRENARPDGLYSAYSHKNIEYWSGTGHTTMIHELGHYGLGLRDEYKNYSNEDASYYHASTCTLNREVVGGAYGSTSPLSACVMDAQWEARNFCDDLAANPHNHDTVQHHYHSMCCWDWIKFKFSDPALPVSAKRWVIRQPTDRGDQVPGPDAVPSSGWGRVYVMNVWGEEGYEWRFTFLKSDGTPFERDQVFLVRYDGTEIPMGWTNRDGQILVHNIYPDNQALVRQWEDGWTEDDTIDYYFDLPDHRSDVTGPLTESVGVRTVQSMQPAKVLTAEAATTLTTRLDLIPGTTISQLLVHLTPSEPFIEPPLMTIWHDNTGGLITSEELTWNGPAGRYEATVELPDTGEPSGRVSVRTIPWGGEEVNVGGDFHLVEVTGENPFLWGSSGGALQIGAFDNAIPSGTILNISTAGGSWARGWRIVKGPFRIMPNNGSTIGGPANITITHSGDADNVLAADMDSLDVYWWNETERNWEKVPSLRLPDRGEVSAPMQQFGSYCIAGPPRFPLAGVMDWRSYQ